MTTLRASDAASAALAFLWYAAADLVPGRSRRVAAKAGLLVAGTVAIGVLERDALAEELAPPAADDASPEPAEPAIPALGPMAAIVASGLVVDLVMRRLSRRRRAAGKRWVHLPSALLAGGYTLAATPLIRRLEEQAEAANRGTA